MQQHRIISLLSVLVMLIIPVIGWFLVAQPQLAAATAADASRVDAAAQVTASQAVVAQLEKDSADLPKLRDELDELRGSIPAGIDPSGWIDGLSALAKVSKVEISALTVSDPVTYVPATPPVDPNAAPPADTTTEDDGTGATATPTEAPAPVDVPGIVTSPLIDGSNFVAIPVTVDVHGTYGTILRFVNGLQTDNRLYLVTSLSMTPEAETGKEKIGKISGFIWAIPTGEKGDPRPVSTVVKSMDPPAPPANETDGTDTPDPNSTETADPNETTKP